VVKSTDKQINGFHVVNARRGAATNYLNRWCACRWI